MNSKRNTPLFIIGSGLGAAGLSLHRAMIYCIENGEGVIVVDHNEKSLPELLLEEPIPYKIYEFERENEEILIDPLRPSVPKFIDNSYQPKFNSSKRKGNNRKKVKRRK